MLVWFRCHQFTSSSGCCCSSKPGVRTKGMALQPVTSVRGASVLAAFLVLSSAWGDNPKIACKTTAGLSFAETDVPIVFPLLSCPAQSNFTCCGGEHDSLLAKLEAACKWTAEDSVSAGIAARCCSRWQTLRCVSCSGVAATGNSAGVCPHLCASVFDACQDVEVGWDANGVPEFCTSDSLACSKLSNVVSNGQQFCTAVGIVVAAPDAELPCFDGAFLPPSLELQEAVQTHLASDATRLQDIETRRSAGTRSGSRRRRRQTFSGADADAFIHDSDTKEWASGWIKLLPPPLSWLLGPLFSPSSQSPWVTILLAGVVAWWISRRFLTPAPRVAAGSIPGDVSDEAVRLARIARFKQSLEPPQPLAPSPALHEAMAEVQLPQSVNFAFADSSAADDSDLDD